MKKKAFLLGLGLFMTLPLFTSCSPFSTNYDYGKAEVVNVTTSVSETVKKVEKACIGIQTRIFINESLTAQIGSGVIFKKVDNTYYCLTNFHVVADTYNKAFDTSSFQISYKVFIGSQNYALDATYVCGSYQKDLAVLKFECKDSTLVKSIELKDTDEVVLTPGETAISIGCPLDLIYFNTVSVGNIAKNKYVVNNNDGTLEVVQHNCGINPGNSGGGLFDSTGRLIGINFKKTNSITENGKLVYVEGINYAISLDEVMQFLSNNRLL